MEYCWTDCFSLEEDLCLFFYLFQFSEHKYFLCLLVNVDQHEDLFLLKHSLTMEFQ